MAAPGEKREPTMIHPPTKNHKWHMRETVYIFTLLGCMLITCDRTNSISHAQQVQTNITPTTGPGDLGTNVSPPNGNVTDITGGTRPGDGANLFHSFGQFNVGEGDTANFLNDTGLPTENILGRVTAGDPSSIFGNVQTTDFGGVNLFLLNPFGFIFGPNSSINIAGAFYTSTADSIQLGENGVFFANLGEESVLTVAAPEAFGFLGNTAPVIPAQNNGMPVTAAIEIQGLNNTNGTPVTFLGRDARAGDNGPIVPGVTVTGTLQNQGGNVELASVASPGNAVLGSLNLENFSQQGQLTIAANAVVNTTPGAAATDNGGKVVIQGGVFRMESNAQIITSPRMGFQPPPPLPPGVPGPPAPPPNMGQGGAVNIVATESASFLNTTQINTSSNLTTGGAGNVDIAGPIVSLDGSTITTSAAGGFPFPGTPPNMAQGGAVTISATESASIVDTPIVTGTQFAAGGAGSVDITAPTVTLNRSQITTTALGLGSAGNVQILTTSSQSLSLIDSSISALGLGGPPFGSVNAGQVILSGPTVNLMNSNVSTDANGGGFAGNVTVNVGNLHVTGGSVLQSQSLAINSGQAGRIRIQGQGGPGTLAESVLIDSESTINVTNVNETLQAQGGEIEIHANQGTLASGGTLTARSASGQAGSVKVNASSFTITGTSASGDPSKINVRRLETPGAAPGTSSPVLDINTTQLTLADGGQIQAENRGDGPGAIVTVQGTGGSGTSADSILITGQDNAGNPSGIFTSTEGTGTGGNVTLLANQVTVNGSGTLSSASTSSDPGAGAAGSVSIQAGNGVVLSGGRVTTETAEGPGGDIAITAGQNIQLTNDSTVLAESSGAGNSGAVTLTATGGNFQSVDSTVSTSAQQAEGGDIAITAGQNVQLVNNTTISAESFGLGDAGDISVTSGNNIQMVNSLITTQAAQASGGNIKLTAPNTIQLVNSQIISSVLGGSETQGGNINLDPQFIILQNSQILANAFLGNGGNITLTAIQGILISPNSTVNASSTFGTSGNVNLRGAVVAIAETITQLPQNIVKIASLFAERCAAQKGGKFSSFVQGGSDGLPPAPGGFLPSPLLLESPGSATIMGSPAELNLNITRLGLGPRLDGTLWTLFTPAEVLTGCSSLSI